MDKIGIEFQKNFWLPSSSLLSNIFLNDNTLFNSIVLEYPGKYSTTLAFLDDHLLHDMEKILGQCT